MTEFLFTFACFDCRIAFKRRENEDASSGTAHQSDSEIEHKCPNCGHRMAFVGRNFEVPPKASNSAWFAAKYLWEAGFRFVGSGFHSDPQLPRKKSEVKKFIEQNPKHVQRVGARQQWENYA